MGQFSWFAQDTKDQIFNDYGKQTIHMVDPRNGHDYIENDYEGYGVFGGRDFYELFADLNKDIIKETVYHDGPQMFDEVYNKKFEDLSEDDIDIKRSDGIDLWFSVIEKEINKEFNIDSSKVVSPVLVEDYSEWERYKDEHPESDPDQGWHCEDEDDEE